MVARLIRCAVVLSAFALAAGPAHAQGGVLYGISNGLGAIANNRIYQIDAATATISNVHQVTLPGFAVGRSLALTAQPGTGTLFAIIQTFNDTPLSRRLVTIDPNTGVATTVGILNGSFAHLAFRPNGVLYGVTGQLGTNAETLYTVSTVDASLTLQFSLGNGDDGETLAFHPNGLMYHASGTGTSFFESVNVDTQQITPIGTAATEMYAMGHLPTTGQFLGSDINTLIFTININTGARTTIGSLGVFNRGFAFVPTAAVPEPTTVALLVGGAVAALAYRYRKRLRARRQLDEAVPDV